MCNRKRKKNINFLIMAIITTFMVIAVSCSSNSSNDTKNDENNLKSSQQNNSSQNLNDIEDKKEVDKIANSGYLQLKDDPNADDASKVIPAIMYPGVHYEFTGQKIAYLTFDDGPSQHVTSKILDVLKANDVKATFFTVGKVIESNSKAPEILKRMAKEGHAIASHGYSHNYNILYPNGAVNVESFMNDLNKNNEVLKKVLGKNFSTRVIRMPGGHGSWKGVTELDTRLAKDGIYQTDWNALNGDAEGSNIPAPQLLDRLKQSIGNKRSIIVLMHDTDAKDTTVQYLQSAIDYLKSQGFVFKTLK